MGANLSALDFGSDFNVSAASNGNAAVHHCVCMLADDVSFKCWGWNDNGQLGLGDEADRYVVTSLPYGQTDAPTYAPTTNPDAPSYAPTVDEPVENDSSSSTPTIIFSKAAGLLMFITSFMSL